MKLTGIVTSSIQLTKETDMDINNMWAVGFEDFFKGVLHCPPTTELEEMQDWHLGWLAAKEDSAYYETI